MAFLLFALQYATIVLTCPATDMAFTSRSEWNIIPAHKSLDDRWKWAAKAKATYRLRQIFMDSLDNKLALTYEAGAFRGFIIERDSKSVVHTMCFGPANVAGKLIGLARFSEAQHSAAKTDGSMPACSFMAWCW